MKVMQRHHGFQLGLSRWPDPNECLPSRVRLNDKQVVISHRPGVGVEMTIDRGQCSGSHVEHSKPSIDNRCRRSNERMRRCVERRDHQRSYASSTRIQRLFLCLSA